MIEIFRSEVNIAFFGQSPFRPVFSEPVGDWWLLLQQFSALINLVLKNESFFCQNFLAKKLSWIIYQRLIAKVQLLLSKEREKERKSADLNNKLILNYVRLMFFHQLVIFVAVWNSNFWKLNWLKTWHGEKQELK